MRTPTLIQSVLATLLLAAAPFAHAQAKFHAIGELPGGATVSQVRDATRVGGAIVAVGGSSANPGSTGMDTPVVWTAAGGLVAIPNLVANPALTSAFASAITPDGAYIASRTRIAPTGGVRHAALVTRAGLTTVDVGTLPGFPGFSAATAISDNGSVLYGFGIHDVANHNQAIRFTFDGSAWIPTPLPFLAVGDDISVLAGRGASADGNIVVGTSVNSSIAGINTTGPGNKAFRYVHGAGVSAIPMLPGGTWNGAIGLSRSGGAALVVGDSSSAPQSEAYLYNFSAGQAVRLGTPNGSRIPNNIGGVSDDGVVVLSWYANGSTPFSGVHNQHGWHDLEDLVERAGLDLAGWDLDTVVGISADSTLVWGSGVHNGNDEGWVIEFPAGYLAAATDPVLADSPNSAIVGTWTLGDVSAPDAVLVFFEDGYYLHVQVAAADEIPSGATGFERGLFRWDQTNGSIQFKTLLDNNGDIGLSGSFGEEGATATVTANTMTFTPPGEDPIQLTRVGGIGQSPILGAFGAVNNGTSGNVFVFLPNNVYFQASYAADMLVGEGTPIPPNGIERGTYTWNSTTGAFTAAAVVDTNGTAGLSSLAGPTTLTIPGDGRVLYANGSPIAPRASGHAVLYGVGDLPGSVSYSEVRDVTKFEGRIIAVGGSAANAGSTSSDTAVIWTPQIGLMTIPNLAVNTTAISPLFASAITPNAVWVAGRTRPSPTGGALHAVRTNTDTLTGADLGTLPGFPGFSTATSISADGSILYGFGVHDGANRNQAIRFTFSGAVWTPTPLPFLAVGDDVSVPAGRGASADGSVVVGTSVNTSIAGSNTTGPGNKAFRYVHGTGVSAIPMLPGGTWNGAIGLSRNGVTAVVVGDSSSAPQSEAYLYNFSTSQAVRLGTPNGSRIPGNLGSVSFDNAVVALSWYSEDLAPFPGVHNQHGWHDLGDLAARAGADLTGWSLNNITGMSPDATLVWGRGSHNGTNEGWVLEFPGGFLANAVEPVPAPVTTPLVGAWTFGDTTSSTSGSGALIFYANGYYMHIEMPEDEDGATAGFERGQYNWDANTGLLTFKTLLDTNGEIGLSGNSGGPGLIVTVSGNTATVHTEDGDVVLTRVTGTSPLVGAFGSANTADDSTAVVFLPNGYFYHVEDGDSVDDPDGRDGMEWGTYTWNPTTHAFTANVLVDTNGDWGLNDSDGSLSVAFSGDLHTLIFTDEDGDFPISRVGGAPAVAGDFNGDGSVDAAWTNPAEGQRAVWLMYGTAIIGGADLGLVDPAWRMAAMADFNADNKPDILWQNITTGARQLWFMNGSTILDQASLGIVPLEWSIATAADFNADGKPDILWQNTTTGERYLWFMNGSTILDRASLGTVPLECSITAAADFNADGKPDILWQNTTTGERYLWFMNGAAQVGATSFGAIPVEWSIVAAADFNGDSKPDVLWQNTSTGERYLWYMNGVVHTADASLGIVSTQWSIAAAADINADGRPDILWQRTGAVTTPSAVSDFNADGKPDILWQNTITGARHLWFMNGSTILDQASLGFVPLEWSIATTADFNADGKPDILWQNTTTGARHLWFMNGSTILDQASLGIVPLEWSITTAADFNADGKPDILWQNTTTGARHLWFMNGSTILDQASLGFVPLEWSIATAADFNADGKPDILWQNTTTGARHLWFMNGSTILDQASLGFVPLEWSIATAADFNADGKPDILWQNTTTGARQLWFMNGSTIIDQTSLGIVPVEWKIVR